MRSFTTTGPIVPDQHYSVPPLERIDLGHILGLIEDQKYCTLHAPRQTGKTSVLLALANLLNDGSAGRYRCLYINVESAEVAHNDVASAITAVIDEIAMSGHDNLADDSIEEICTTVLALNRPHTELKRVLSRWARVDPRPLVLLVDEIDSLVGDSLLTVLRQLWAGYHLRPKNFPHSVILCGVRDLQDYRIHSSSEKEPVTGGSAFNISADSLRLGDFSHEEVLATVKQLVARGSQAGGGVLFFYVQSALAWGPDSAGTAHRRDRSGLLAGRGETHMGPNLRPALASQCAMQGGLLPIGNRPRPLASDHEDGHPRGSGATHPQAGHAP